MKNFLNYCLAAFLFISCSDDKISDQAHYNALLENKDAVKGRVQAVDQEIEFWTSRLQNDTGNFVDMMELAHRYNQRFSLTGTIQNLVIADSFMLRSSEKLAHTNPDIFFSRSQTAITMHRFRDAYQFNNLAIENNGAAYTSSLLAFDAGVELGLYKQSYRELNRIADKESVDYMIRKAKEADHEGDLDAAIALTEQVLDKAKKMEHPMLISWAQSTLGDMYGHAGRIQDAYNSYMDVLKNDPAHMYALKGLAWIIFSHEKNTREANRIIEYIHSQTSMPDLYLMQAEMAAYNGDMQLEKMYQDKFLQIVNTPCYGDMYNKYLIQIYSEDPKYTDKAVAIAEKELQNRNTPETNDWYAWSLYKQGNIEKAYKIASSKVYMQTFEPDALLHTAYIFEAKGEKSQAKKMLEACLESSFELGPLTTASIKYKLRSL